jgi:hypothetical protein
MTMKIGVLLFASAIIGSGCIDNTTYATQERSDKVAEYILKTEPKPQHSMKIDMEGKVEFLGYDLKAANPRPGSKLEITWYWKAKKDVGPGWRLFTHCMSDGGSGKFNRDTSGPVRASFQPEHWRAGMIIKDTQTFSIPKDWDADNLEVRVGLWKGSERMKGNTGMDDANRIRGPKLKLKAPAPKKPPVTIAYTAVPPKIDGKFKDEEAWKSATLLNPFVTTMKGTPVAKKTEMKVMWDEKNLYIAFTAEDQNLKSQYTKQDDELWHEDAFEMFIDPLADKTDYYELQVSPKGIVFDSHLPKYRKNQNEWSSKMVQGVSVDGTVNNDSDADKGWSGEIAVPFASLSTGGGVPPKAGDIWAVNFFRIDAGGEKAEYSAWSAPMRGDFHTLAKFGRIQFGKPGEPATSEKPTPATKPAPAAKPASGDKPEKPNGAAEKPVKSGADKAANKPVV